LIIGGFRKVDIVVPTQHVVPIVARHCGRET
jgi:hypothetical protein